MALMNKTLKWVLSAALALGMVLALLVGAAAWWLSGDGWRLQLQNLASARLGVPVTLDKLSMSVWPLPQVALEGIRVQTQPPLLAQKVQLRPAWGSLLGWGGSPRQLEIRSLLLEGVSLPQRGLDELQQSLSKQERSAQSGSRPKAQKALNAKAGGDGDGGGGVALAKADADAGSGAGAEVELGSGTLIAVGWLAIPQQVNLERVVWQSAAGERLALSGRLQASEARDEVVVDLKMAGGTLRGPLRFVGLSESGAGGAPPGQGKAGSGSVQLRGELVTSGMSLAALPGIGAQLGGSLQATTTVQAQAPRWAQLGSALQTRTQFDVSAAVVKGVDLAKAVTTLGLSRGGETALQQLSGSLTTRGSGAPMQLSLTELQAKSKLLSASGAVNVGAAARAGAPRPLSGRVSVDLTAGDSVVAGAGTAMGALVGIPLEISGTTANPQVQPTRGAMIGGAIGSVMAPVIGTGAGAKLGDKAATTLGNLKEKLFGK
jgi:hypothetical protein